MCKCANRLRVFMQQNGFVKSENKYTHPNGMEYTEQEVSSKHTSIMAKLLKDKVLGKL